MSTVFFYWDVKPAKDKDYIEFIFQDYLPSMAKAGIDVTDGWIKIAGEGSQIIAVGECETADSARTAMKSREFLAVEARLLKFVENYSKHLGQRDNKIEGR